MTTQERLLRLRGILAALTEMDSLDLDDLTIHEVVEIGSVLWKLTTRAGKTLNRVKERLRDAALRRDGGEPGVVHFNGLDEGTAFVRVGHPVVRLRKGATFEDIADAIGADKLNLLFETSFQIRPRRDFEEGLEALSDEQRGLLAGFLDLRDPTHQVSFNPRYGAAHAAPRGTKLKGDSK